MTIYKSPAKLRLNFPGISGLDHRERDWFAKRVNSIIASKPGSVRTDPLVLY